MKMLPETQWRCLCVIGVEHVRVTPPLNEYISGPLRGKARSEGLTTSPEAKVNALDLHSRLTR